MSKKMIIAVDGPAASGKGTLARRMAEELNFAHMDTGALYRAVANIVMTAGHEPDDEQQAILAAQYLRDHFTPKMLDNPSLRLDECGQGASKVASIPAVRDALFELQQNFAQNPPEPFMGAVLDGRDIGTVICPGADFKLFITASTEVRAKRRLKELQSRGIDVTYDHVLADMRERDARDQSRKAAPLKAAADAITLDTSDLSIEDALDAALKIIRA